MTSPTFYFRLTNSFNGPAWALGVVPGGSGILKISPAGDNNDQHWSLTHFEGVEGAYHITSRWRGGEYSLCFAKGEGDEEDRIWLAKTENVAGQAWHLSKVEPSFAKFKLQNELAGSGEFLDVYTDRKTVRMSRGDADGTHWAFTLAKI
ncbi:hypothetical protein BKA70DRAFT_1559204 [Coprinopsis sp. MPI-PUGE-AT-0042]|nr:hypothetical protein BKA70DRAFT_1559204 [Coprinopsis sp. MPI-PUGE-AT-0042]